MNYSDKDSLSMNIGSTVVQDKKGYIWIGCQYGLNRFDGISVSVFTKEEGLPDNYIYEVEKDNQGWLWLATNKGVCRWDKKDKFHYYMVNRGLPSNENNSNSCYKDSKGRIWFSTPKGVARIDPNNILINRKIPPVYIEEVKVNNKKKNYHEKLLELKPGENNIFIKFTALKSLEHCFTSLGIGQIE